ncbi:MAG: DUF389 domain-containing protein [bacterium]
MVSGVNSADTLSDLEVGASPSGAYFLLTALSCVLATLGLIVNSVAVIIGAMLVAPLMGPILGVALASVSRRPGLYRKALISLVLGVGMAVLLSTIVAYAARNLPFGALQEIPAEVESRGRPSVFDLAIALAGGAAGAYAALRMKGAAALVGVAIATALMPPLCSVGIGLAVDDASLARGASLLFLTNLVAIIFAALLVFAALGLRSNRLAFTALQGVLAAAGLLFMAGLLTVLTVHAVNDARDQGRVRQAVVKRLSEVLPGAELLSLERESNDGTLKIRMRVQVPGEVTREDVRSLQEGVADDLQRTLEISFVGVPTLQLDPVLPVASRVPTATPTLMPTATPTAFPSPTATASATPTAAPTPPVVGNSGASAR